MKASRSAVSPDCAQKQETAGDRFVVRALARLPGVCRFQNGLKPALRTSAGDRFVVRASARLPGVCRFQNGLKPALRTSVPNPG